MSASERLALLRHDPAGTVLAFDFDGTLSPIVDDPAAAAPHPGTIERLAVLARTYRSVTIVSGRPVSFLAAVIPEQVDISGVYGLEWRRAGTSGVSPEAEPWVEVVGRAVADAEAARIDGLVVESKGLSATLHYRNRPAAGPEVSALAADLASETGLQARDAKMSVELHPPIETDKGVVVRRLAEEARAALYAGDDLGDLPAFAALSDLRADGLATVSVAVASDEAPERLLAEADLVVDGPPAMVELMDALLEPPPH